MARDRDYVLRDGVLFDVHNLNETASHCWVRNRYLQGLAATAAEARELLLTLVLEHVAREKYHLGQMAPAYNAWFVVDGFDAKRPYTPPGIDRDEAATIRLEVNFFVRPGREPILRDAAA
jgi:hypothetical protein